jgi:hypothetical protein
MDFFARKCYNLEGEHNFLGETLLMSICVWPALILL